MDTNEKIMREFEAGVTTGVDALTANYQTIVASGFDTYGKNLVIRNNLTEQVRIRFNSDDDSTMTVKAGDKLIIGGFSKLSGMLIEAKTEVDVPDSFILNIFN